MKMIHLCTSYKTSVRMSFCHQSKKVTKMKSFTCLCMILLASANADYGPTIAALTTTSDVEANSNCGDDASGYYEVYETDDYRYVIVSGAPTHPAEYDQETTNPNERCERWQYVALPLTWEDSGSTTQQMGATGYVTSGAVTFDARSSDDGDLAAYYEWDTLDPYYGHSNAVNQYHYHAVSLYFLVVVIV